MECPNCGSEKIKRNGHIHNGKQNHRCNSCGRQFVLNSEQKIISSETKELINRLLLEKISLAGIARSALVSEEWLSDYIAKVYAEQPDDLCAEIPDQAAMNTHLEERFDEYIYKIAALEDETYLSSTEEPESGDVFESYLSEITLDSELNTPLLHNLYERKDGVLYEVYRFEADEMWSFVQNKGNKQWIWLVMNTANRQIVAFHVGGRGKEDARILFDKIPGVFKTNAVFFTDFWNGYDILDQEKHKAAGKEKGYTNHIERFNNTLRQRCSRLVRKTLSFSKKLSNHIGAIKYFICHYNKCLALHI